MINNLKLDRSKYYRVSGIYMLYDEIQNKYYIGSSCNLYRRISQHLVNLSNNHHHSIKLQRHVNKYGLNNLKVKIIYQPDIELELSDLRKIEQIYLNAYWGPNCLNMSNNVENVINYKTRKRANEGVKNAWKENFEKMKEKVNPNIVCAREKLKEKYNGQRPWLKGFKHSKEALQKMSEATKSRGPNIYVMKKICQYDINNNYIREFDSCLDAAKNFGKNYISGITRAARGYSHTAYDYIWKYKELNNAA